MKNVLIFNAVPTNNGDAALVFSLYNALKSKGYEVKIATHKFEIVSKLYPEFPLVREITDYEVLRKVFLSKYIRTILTPFLFFFSASFRKADFLIASPGGYMNSYYGFSRICATIVTGKLLGKKTAIYAQSIGPLNSIDRWLLRTTSYFFDVIYARDRFSYDMLNVIGVKKYKIMLGEDGAFLIPARPTPPSSNKIAFSVRAWKRDSRDFNHYKKLIALLVQSILESGYAVEFLSTCQGLPNYVDDSIVAEEIARDIPSTYRNRVTVNKKFYRIDELQDYLGQFEAVIGTRLHMCILALLEGKPCFNISYEVKGKEAFTYLGLEKFSIDYNHNFDEARSSIRMFLNSLSDLKSKLGGLMKLQNKKADDFLKIFLNKVTA